MFDYLKTVNNLNEIFEWINVYPDGDVKVHILYTLLFQYINIILDHNKDLKNCKVSISVS